MNLKFEKAVGDEVALHFPFRIHLWTFESAVEVQVCLLDGTAHAYRILRADIIRAEDRESALDKLKTHLEDLSEDMLNAAVSDCDALSALQDIL